MADSQTSLFDRLEVVEIVLILFLFRAKYIRSHLTLPRERNVIINYAQCITYKRNGNIYGIKIEDEIN